MARRMRTSRLETRTARLRLTVRVKPYDFQAIAPAAAIGYRRNKGAGAWVLRTTDGKGGRAYKNIGAADDFADADGDQILNWFQAVDRGRRVVRGDTIDPSRPATVADALEEYRRDLQARRAGPENAGRIAKHLPPRSPPSRSES